MPVLFYDHVIHGLGFEIHKERKCFKCLFGFNKLTNITFQSSNVQRKLQVIKNFSINNSTIIIIKFVI